MRLLGGSSQLQPACPTTSPWDGKTLLPSLPLLSTPQEAETPSPGPPRFPLCQRVLRFGLGWEKTSAEGDGEVVPLPSRRASAAHAASPWTSIDWRAAVPAVSVSAGRRTPGSYGSCLVPPWVPGLFC